MFDNIDFAPKENVNGTPSNIVLLKYEKKTILNHRRNTSE